MATLRGKIADVTGRAPDSISSITVKAPSVRVGGGTDLIVSSPATVDFDRSTGDVTISGLTGGLSWLYLEGEGWSDSIALSVAEGMISLVEAIANASSVPGIIDYLKLLADFKLRFDETAQDAVDAAADGIKWSKGLVPAATNSISELDDGSWVVGSASLSSTLGLPVVGVGHLVKRTVLGGTTAQWTTLAVTGRVPETWFASTTGSGVWGKWIKVGTDEDSTSSKHEVLVADLKARRGGRKITKGGAVSLVVDHGTNGFNEVYLPMLRARGMTATIALNSDMYNPENYRYEFDNRTSWDTVRGWYENDGIEIANHGRTHATTSEDEAYDEIVGGLEELKTFLPNVPIDTFVTHGGLGTGMPDYNHGRDIEVFYDTVAGRLIHEHHACSVSGATPQTFPLTGDPHVGVYRYWVETPALINTAKTAIQNAIDSNHGVVISFHPETMTGEGKATNAEFEAFLDWIKSFIDAGELTMLTLRDMMVTEYAADPKEVALKADKSELAVKADKSYVDGSLEPKADKSYVDSLTPLRSFVGTGSPEGRIAAPVGSVYTDSAATNGAIRWIKTSGTGATGWVVEYGDTGWRLVANRNESQTGEIYVRRVMDTCFIRVYKYLDPGNYATHMATIPSGFRPTGEIYGIIVDSSASSTNSIIGSYTLNVLSWTRNVNGGHERPSTAQSGELTYSTSQPWPTTLPGTPA